jgi:hypothetical protein
MRNSAVAAAALVIVVVALVLVAVARPESSVVATPTPTPAVSATPSPTTPTPTSAPPASPSATTSGAVGAVTIQATRTTVPAEFRYLVLGGGSEVRLMVLDLNAGRLTQVATARIALAPNPQRDTYASISASADGRVVLLALDVPEATDSLFVIRPESGDARLLLRGEVRGAAAISADGARVAVGRNDEDPSLTGLWVGTVADGAMRRLVADDPHSNASPPLPYGFSPDGALIAFGLGLGESGRQAMVVATSANEGRVDPLAGGARVVGTDASVLGPAMGATFRSARDVFVWSSRSVFGGMTVVYVYDLATKQSREIYRPSDDLLITAAALRPNADEYATVERPSCCGIFVPGTAAWLRGTNGSARKLGDAVFVVDMWWSRDGSRLFALVGGDDATGGVTDLLTGKGVIQFCKRGGGPPPAPCT